MQCKNQVVILGKVFFEKWNRTVESERSADQVHPTLMLLAGLQGLFYILQSLDVCSPKMELIW